MRNLTVGMQSAISQQTVRPVFLVSLEFGASTVVYLNDRTFDITWGGHTYLGNGWLRPLKTVEETSDVKAVGCEITLNGTIAELLSYALVDARISNRGRVWLGMLDSTNSLIADPYQIFAGKLDIPTIQVDETTITLTLAYESDLRGLERPNEFRFTDQSQKALYSDDKGFEYVVTVEKWDGYWGKPERPKWIKFKRSK
jgi:hypothetical protein